MKGGGASPTPGHSDLKAPDDVVSYDMPLRGWKASLDSVHALPWRGEVNWVTSRAPGYPDSVLEYAVPTNR